MTSGWRAVASRTRVSGLAAAALLFPAAAAAGPADPPTTPAAQETAPDPAATMRDVLVHERRMFDRRRDRFRHPAETLAFFRVQPGMTVIDFMPGTGWYTRILVPYLGAGGRYLAVHPALTGSAAYRQAVESMDAGFRQRLDGVALPGAPIEAIFSNELESRRGTVDRALIFREMHNLRNSGALADELAAIRAALKPDGLLGIVQHRARADAPSSYADGAKGYMREADVIGLVEKQGFVLVDRSEINANPADTADHPQGVWELPPALRTGRAELRGIGESDRMTLLFRKRR